MLSSISYMSPQVGVPLADTLSMLDWTLSLGTYWLSMNGTYPADLPGRGIPGDRNKSVYLYYLYTT